MCKNRLWVGETPIGEIFPSVTEAVGMSQYLPLFKDALLPDVYSVRYTQTEIGTHQGSCALFLLRGVPSIAPA